MHESSRENMRVFIEKYVRGGTRLLDVGSREVDGQSGSSYRGLLAGMDVEYTGCDMDPGQNVDVVLRRPYAWSELPAGSFDYVVSGQMLEHAEFPWLTLLEIHRVLRPGGICCVIAPSAGFMHNYPLDCYRYYPDGMVALAHTAHLQVLEAYTNWSYEGYPWLDPVWKDTVLIARKEKKLLRNWAAGVKRAAYHAVSPRSLGPVSRTSLNSSGPGCPPPSESRPAPSSDEAQQRDLFRRLTAGKPLNDLERFFGEEEHLPIYKCLNYFDVYDRYFSRYRGSPVTILEIGVAGGGSLQMWKNYFGPLSRVVGVDIDPECKKREEAGIEIFIGDQRDRDFWRALKAAVPRVDILLDDGGHTMEQQAVAFEEMFPHLAPDGLYLCEDLHTSYRPGYGGGYLRPGTFVERAKALVDSLNAWHSETPALRPDVYTRSIRGLHFYDGIVVVEKGSRTGPPDILRI
ncbi:methyltransferase domain-containing protein [Papillibacter cinnamivorans]|uniref:Methyltransferase domain-containing protein n=1 Tax=Papillibacter cinnamivorans DSM 12816 TaxID=1122930 RepID=A0A1W1ZIB3_9FIRM|nr:methyltransferase domain-containing protein [Papillibacter cinnamivorans]SMC48305.1 Methyltransferase domain-containing protein [Papillibacter cinnamivorans DSM 12816]